MADIELSTKNYCMNAFLIVAVAIGFRQLTTQSMKSRLGKKVLQQHCRTYLEYRLPISTKVMHI